MNKEQIMGSYKAKKEFDSLVFEIARVVYMTNMSRDFPFIKSDMGEIMVCDEEITVEFTSAPSDCECGHGSIKSDEVGFPIKYLWETSSNTKFGTKLQYILDKQKQEQLEKENANKITINHPILVQGLADTIHISTSELIKNLTMRDSPGTTNQLLSVELATNIAKEFGYIVSNEKDK